MTRAKRSRTMRCIVIGAFLLAGAHAAFAQGTSPSNPPPPTVPTPRGQPQAGSDEIGCPATFTPTGGAGLVTDVASAQRKNWQPAGGEITFTVRSFDKFNTDKRPIVCFRWRTMAANDQWAQAELDRVTLSDDHKTMQVTVTIPELQTPAQPKIRSLGIVPLADVGILLPATATGEQRIVVTTTIGITSVVAAFIGAIAVGALAFFGLLMVG